MNNKRRMEEIEKVCKWYTKEYYCDLSLEEIDKLKSLKINRDKSYLVIHPDYNELKKFVFWYLLDGRERTFLTYTIDEFITAKYNRYQRIINYDPYDYEYDCESKPIHRELDTDCNVLILYHPKDFERHNGGRGELRNEGKGEISLGERVYMEVAREVEERNDDSGYKNIITTLIVAEREPRTTDFNPKHRTNLKTMLEDDVEVLYLP